MSLDVTANRVLTTIELRGTRQNAGSTLKIRYLDPYLIRLGLEPIVLTDVTTTGLDWVARVPTAQVFPVSVALILIENVGGAYTIVAKKVTLVADG